MQTLLGEKNKLLNDGTFLFLNYGKLFRTTSDLSDSYIFNNSIYKIIDGKPTIKDYCVSNKGEIYVVTEIGLFKSPSISDSFKLIAFNDVPIEHVFIDDNNYLYVNIKHDIATSYTMSNYISKDDGKTWYKINSNLSDIDMEGIYAYGDSKLLVYSAGLNYADLKNARLLNIKDSIQNKIVYYDDGTEYSFKVTDDDGKGVNSAGIVINNTLIHQLDTIYTDISGNARYKLNYKFLNPNEIDYCTIYTYAFKVGYCQSSLNTKTITYHSHKKDLYCTGKNYTWTKPDSTANILIGIGKKADSGSQFEHAQGKILARNELFVRTDTIIYNTGYHYNYTINVPAETRPGMYRISLKGISEAGDTTTEHIMYLWVSDSSGYYNDIKEIQEESKLEIFPNPVSDFLMINNPSPRIELQTLQIFSALGIKLMEMEYKERIDVSALTPGVYFVKVGDKVGKFVKM